MFVKFRGLDFVRGSKASTTKNTKRHENARNREPFPAISSPYKSAVDSNECRDDFIDFYLFDFFKKWLISPVIRGAVLVIPVNVRGIQKRNVGRWQ